MSLTPATTAASTTPNVHPSLALPGLSAEHLQKLAEIRPGDILLVTATTKHRGIVGETEQGGGWGSSTYNPAPVQSWDEVEQAENVGGWGDDAVNPDGEQQYLDTHQRPTVHEPINLEGSRPEISADASRNGYGIEVVPLDDEQPTQSHETNEDSTEQLEDVIESHNAPAAHISANAHEELSLGGRRENLDDSAHRDLDEAALASNEHVSEGESVYNGNLDLTALGSVPHPLQSDVVDNIISQYAAVPLNAEQNTQIVSNTAASTEEQFYGSTMSLGSATAVNEHEQPEAEFPQGAGNATARQEDISSVDVHHLAQTAEELETLTVSSNAGSVQEYVPTHNVETVGGQRLSIAEMETAQRGSDADLNTLQDRGQHDSLTPGLGQAPVSGPPVSTQRGWTSSNVPADDQDASMDGQFVQDHDDDAAHQVDDYGDDQAYNNEEQDYDDDDQGYNDEQQGYDDDDQGYNDDSCQSTHIHGYNAAGEPTRSILFGVAAVYKNADRQLMEVYLQPLNYKESVSMADSKTYRIYGNDVLVHDVAAFTIDDDLESFTQSFVAEDHVEYSIEVNPTGDHLRISHLQRTCPNSNCQEGYLSCLENLQDGIPDALPSLSPFRPLCPVCLGKDLMEEQVHLRRLMEANQLLAHNLSLAIEHVQKRSERRVLVWGVSEVFDEHAWGFDFDALRPSGSRNTTDGDYYDGDDIPWDQMHPDARDPNINIVERPASETAIAALPRVLLQDLPIETHESDESRPLCTICSGELGDDTVMMVMPCSHAFCECLAGWLRRQRSCPQCRTVIPGEEIQVVEESVGAAETNEDMLNANGDAAEAVGSGVTDGQTDFANSNQLDLMDAYTADVNTPEAQAGHVWSAREAITSTSVGPGTAEVQSSW